MEQVGEWTSGYDGNAHRPALLCITVHHRALPCITVPLPCGTIDLDFTVMDGTSRLGIPGEGYGEERVVDTQDKVYDRWMDNESLFELERAYCQGGGSDLTEDWCCYLDWEVESSRQGEM